MLSEVRQTDKYKYYMLSLICGTKKKRKKEKMISQNRIVIGRGWWLGRCMSTGTNSVIRRINSESLIYSMVTTVNVFQILYT